MKKISNLVKLFTGFAALGANSSESLHISKDTTEFDYLNEVETAPLNTGDLPIYLAQHRSHASHSSHASHRSSNGTRSTPTPTPAPRRVTPSPAPRTYSEPLSQPPRPAATIPSKGEIDFNRVMSDEDKRKNIILRVQLTLAAVGIYKQELDGIMGKSTRDAVNSYRMTVGMPLKEKLDVEVLNSLGILVQ
jgi:His-Xaa-Ser repeat protein HxsA